jgi:hypothetical protein
MQALLICLIASGASSTALGDDEDGKQVREHFKSDNYTVEWGDVRTLDAGEELEIGYGSGHGFTLGWLRFQPQQDSVDVLSIELIRRRLKPYQSKWPPDQVPVVIKRAEMKRESYIALLRDLALVNAAELHPVRRHSGLFSTNDFWVYVRLVAGKKTCLDLEWAGYWCDRKEADFAKPQAAVTLAREAVEMLEFKDYTLNKEDREWASAKFNRDWMLFKNAEFHWWVRERYIMMIGVAGEKSALSTLRGILPRDPGEESPMSTILGILSRDPRDRSVYYAINAITRITKIDVRDKPVEEMDLEITRGKVLDMLREFDEGSQSRRP